MTNTNFLSAYQHLQYGIMYHKLVDTGFSSIAWSKEYQSPFFNHAQIQSEIDKAQLGILERELTDLDRKPALYFEKTTTSGNIISFLKKNGYKKHWEDSWMFHDGKNLQKTKLHHVKKVQSKTDLEEFLNTFNKCYQKDDPQNPYGELGNYIDVARVAWEKHSNTKLEYFTVYKNSQPVAVSSLTSFAGIGYISNVGSLKKVRGEGFGKTASLYAVLTSIKNKNSFHTLATEEGHYPNEFYTRIGFKTKFSAWGYVSNT